MQQAERQTELAGMDRKRMEAVVATLATIRNQGETLAEVAHDARNMVTALALYCDLLEEPGVLAAPFLHYGNELRLVAAASSRLVEKLVALDTQAAAGIGALTGGLSNRVASLVADTSGPDGAGFDSAGPGAFGPGRVQLIPFEPVAAEPGAPGMGHAGPLKPRTSPPDRAGRWDLAPASPIESLAAELLATRSLLGALAGPSIALTVDIQGGARPVWLTGEDLTRILVNLVKNSAEAMPAGGRIQIGLRELTVGQGAAPDPEQGTTGTGSTRRLMLTIEDNGPGVPHKSLDRIFESGFTTHTPSAASRGGWSNAHRGLGLSITRSIVEGAGGEIRAAHRPRGGARFEIELPVRTR
jgi:signal transduction histidine kinase